MAPTARDGAESDDMIHSMTGYAALSHELPHTSLSIELKSVNGRFLDVQFRLPEELRAIEPALRERVTASVARGKVECRMAFQPAAAAHPEIAINEALLAALAGASARVRAALSDAQPLRVGEVLHWPGMLSEEAGRSESLRAAALELAQRALAEFAASRAREGVKLKAMLLERVARMQQLLEETRPRLPEAIAAYEERLGAKLREAIGGGEEERIRQEIAVFGVKIDVAEELGRLGAHLHEVRRVLEAGGACGKRLDFLMQELNREANTLGSKSVSREISEASLEFKLLIEQMREQIQNIE